jgi:hypothetical protein
MTEYFRVEIKYNDKDVVSCSSKRAGISLHLYTSKYDTLHLRITCKIDDTKYDRFLKTILPGDKFYLKYSEAFEQSLSNISEIESYERDVEKHQLRSGKRYGIDFYRNDGYKVRCSHPDNGGFSFMLGNIPRDHARTFLMAGNDIVQWHWQLADLYFGDTLKFEIVETDWWDEAPIIENKENNS